MRSKKSQILHKKSSVISTRWLWQQYGLSENTRQLISCHFSPAHKIPIRSGMLRIFYGNIFQCSCTKAKYTITCHVTVWVNVFILCIQSSEQVNICTTEGLTWNNFVGTSCRTRNGEISEYIRSFECFRAQIVWNRCVHHGTTADTHSHHTDMENKHQNRTLTGNNLRNIIERVLYRFTHRTLKLMLP